MESYSLSAHYEEGQAVSLTAPEGMTAGQIKDLMTLMLDYSGEISNLVLKIMLNDTYFIQDIDTRVLMLYEKVVIVRTDTVHRDFIIQDIERIENNG